MKLKRIILYITEYTSTTPCYFIHEASHYMMALFCWAIGLNSFPKLIVTRWYSFQIDVQNNNITHTGVQMHVNFDTDLHFRFHRWHIALITVMPAITTIALLLLSPWWLKFYWISNLATLWLSVGDIREIKLILRIY